MSVNWHLVVRSSFAALALLAGTGSVLSAHAASPDSRLAGPATAAAWAPLGPTRADECAIVLAGLGGQDSAAYLGTYLVASGVRTLGNADLASPDAPASVTDLQALLAQVQAHPDCSKLVLAYASSQPAPFSTAALASLLAPLASHLRFTLLLDTPLAPGATSGLAGAGLHGTLISMSTSGSFSLPLVLAAARQIGTDPMTALPGAGVGQVVALESLLPAPTTVPAAFSRRSSALTVLGTFTLVSPALTPCGSAPAGYTATLELGLSGDMFTIYVPDDNNAVNPGTLGADGSFSTFRDGETYAGHVDMAGNGTAVNTYGYDNCTWTYNVTFAPIAK